MIELILYELVRAALLVIFWYVIAKWYLKNHKNDLVETFTGDETVKAVALKAQKYTKEGLIEAVVQGILAVQEVVMKSHKGSITATRRWLAEDIKHGLKEATDQGRLPPSVLMKLGEMFGFIKPEHTEIINMILPYLKAAPVPPAGVTQGAQGLTGEESDPNGTPESMPLLQGEASPEETVGEMQESTQTR